MKQFNREEMLLLFDVWEGTLDKTLQKNFPNRTLDEIKITAIQLRLYNEINWSEEELKILTDNFSDMTNKELSDLLPKRTRLAIQQKGVELNLRKSEEHISRISTRRIYTVNENYFNEIDTFNKAYFLGFLYADGYNNEKNYSFSIRLKASDKSLLEKFKKEIEYCGNLYEVKRHYKAFDLQISSKKLSQNLAKYGCFQNKSLKLAYPKFLHQDLHRDFIRGYFDGDGSLGIYNDKLKVSFIGTYDMLFHIKHILSENLYIGDVSITKRKTENVYRFQMSRQSVMDNLFNFMYKNHLNGTANITLERKFKLWKEFLK